MMWKIFSGFILVVNFLSAISNGYTYFCLNGSVLNLMFVFIGIGISALAVSELAQ